MTGSPIWHPFTQHGLNEPIPLVTHAEGASLFTADGARVVDAISSWWVTTHGHAHPRIAAAIGEQAQKLDQLIFAGWTHQPAQTVTEGLVDMVGQAVGEGALPYVFFSDSGSTCVEVALKMALGHWAHRGENRHRILVMQHSYHGDTIGAMSVGERGVYNAAYAPLLFDVGVIPYPHPGAEQATYDALEAECRANAAAFIVEPLILGAGGMLFYPPHVLAEMARICAAHGVLFIADEVMTGWGRTGTFLACEQAGVAPDILCLAKGLTGGSMPLAVTLASEAIYQSHYSTDRAKTFYHSSSYTANPIACAAAAENLAIWREEPVRERIALLAERQAAGAAMLAQVEGIANARTCGTILALDYVVEGAGYLSSLQPRLLAFFREAGLLIRPLGNTAYLMPPYCISEEDLGRCHQALAEAVKLVKG
ncbi:adenosylmethionine--8-amino-7-oxononanoate transaminase [Novosphingobium rosa]|uniref:adenosylmethionine--8-amino-7-oxononanoate transaminase n=1 Tax=Novosphingobium rosa TaxID=76978 RepID=UPI00083157DE|nr:adenosylmethionine--8-amino-7-oxononanoate transaminase [Novosphingobium rosa]